MLKALKKIFPTEEWGGGRRSVNRNFDWWKKLGKGKKIRFGYMPQENITGKELYISDVVGYDFGHSKFLSHILQNDKGKPICQMIVAHSNHEGSYLVISRHLSKDELFSICSEEDIELFKQSGKINNLFVRENIRGFEGWLSMRYSKKIEGVRGTRNIAGIDKIFDYTLLVNDDNSRAIEIEHYVSGQCDVYVTVYRPVSDVVGISRLIHKSKPDTVVKLKTKNEYLGDDDNRVVPKHEPEVVAKVAKLNSEPSSVLPISEADNNETNILRCDMKLAARIIDEAVANDMRLADVVRRVIGLSINPSEEVGFDFPLSGDEYKMLGQRYNLPANSHDAIQARIVEDLKSFAGDG